MTIELSVFAVVVLTFVLHTVLENLFNWWARTAKEDGEMFLFLFLYSLRILAILVILNKLLK